MNKVKGSPAIIYSSAKCDSDQHEPLVRHEVVILNDATWARCLARIGEYNQLSTVEKYRELDRFISTVNSYTGLLKNRTSYKRIMVLKEIIADDWWQWLDWDTRRQCVVSKPEHTFRARLCKKYNLKLKRI